MSAPLIKTLPCCVMVAHHPFPPEADSSRGESAEATDSPLAKEAWVLQKSYWVYVLKSDKNGRHYIGSGRDFAERLRRHNLGDYKYTKGHRPWKLIYHEAMGSRSEAVKKEMFLKTGVGRKMFKELICG